MVVRGRKIKAVTNEAVTAAFALTSSHFPTTSASQDNSESFIHTFSFSDTCFFDQQKQWQKRGVFQKGWMWCSQEQDPVRSFNGRMLCNRCAILLQGVFFFMRSDAYREKQRE